MALAVTFYLFVKALHVIAVLAAYGLPLAYPLFIPYVRRRHPHAMPGVHDIQHRLNQRLTGPGTVLILVFGAYLASKYHYWGKPWVIVPLAILLVIGGVGGGIIVPASRQMAQLARADVDAGAGGATITWSAEYDRVYRRYMAAEVFLGVLVIVAVFFMVAKPFG